MVWSKLRRTDGFIPTGGLARLTDEANPAEAARELVRATLWAAAPGGWQIVDYLTTQMSAARVEQMKQGAAERYDAWRAKHPDHPRGKPQRVANTVANGPALPPALPPAREGAEGGGGAPLGQEAAAATPTDDLTRRRDLARAIREAKDERHQRRFRRTFEAQYGDLYPVRAAAS
jgi:hypothetical protein